MNASLPRLTQRLLVTALALGAMVGFGEPLPETCDPSTAIVAEAPSDADRLTLTIKQETKTLQREATAAAAARMRWFLTLPASAKRCAGANCAG